MKSFKPFFFLLLMAITYLSSAQITTPSASPGATFTQAVGLAEVKVEYSRPNAKGRQVFGANGLVPNDAFWRTGANSATKITFSSEVMVEGAKLNAGSYAILTKPGSSSWMVNFYPHEGTDWTAYQSKTPAASVKVNPMDLPFAIETFSIFIGDVTATGATLQIIWDTKLVPVSITVDTDTRVMASIERVMAGPSNNDYFTAGSYYHDAGKDLEKALMYVQKATKSNPAFWQLRKESLILADLKRYPEAIETAKKSLALATEAKNNDYIKMNNDSIKEWSMKK